MSTSSSRTADLDNLVEETGTHESDILRGLLRQVIHSAETLHVESELDTRTGKRFILDRVTAYGLLPGGGVVIESAQGKRTFFHGAQQAADDARTTKHDSVITGHTCGIIVRRPDGSDFAYVGAAGGPQVLLAHILVSAIEDAGFTCESQRFVRGNE